MNVFYLESGSLKAGRIIKDTGSSLQVQSQFGKQVKIKSNHVFIEFDHQDIDTFVQKVDDVASSIDADLLWEAFDSIERNFEDVTRIYFGTTSTKEDTAGVLKVLFDNPTHFYKKGKGLFKPATPDALASAKVSLEIKRQRELQLTDYIARLEKNEFPKELSQLIPRFLYKREKNAIEEKALDEVCARKKLDRRSLLISLGVMPDPYDFHMGRFLFEHAQCAPGEPRDFGVKTTDGLSPAHIDAYSIDDAATTEIDDALSLLPLSDGGWQLGIHISAPSLLIEAESTLDKELRRRMSTVYHPAGKMMMSPQKVVDECTLKSGKQSPVVSLYVELDSEFAVIRCTTKLELLTVRQNLNIEELEEHFDSDSCVKLADSVAGGLDLHTLYRIANKLRIARGEKESHHHRREFSFRVFGDSVTIKQRKRGSAIDVIVSELMIFANTHWAKQLKSASCAALYRVKTKTQSGLSLEPLPHSAMGVEVYGWFSSPLRRYVDLLNQRQLIALIEGAEPPYSQGDERLPAILHEFENKYSGYAEFQRTMERFWCLKWLQQMPEGEFEAHCLRDGVIQLDDIPLTCKLIGATSEEASELVRVKMTDINLYDNDAICELV